MGRNPSPLNVVLVLNQKYKDLLNEMNYTENIKIEKKEEIQQPQQIINQNTNFKKCWWCRRVITLKDPIIAPMICNKQFSMSEAQKKFYTSKTGKDDVTGIYEGEGQFDTYPCAKSYILQMIN